MEDYDYMYPDYEAYESEVGIFGDARRCPHHPGVKTSSDDGMFDCECYLCEGEMEDYQAHMDEVAYNWDRNPENNFRRHCGIPFVYGDPDDVIRAPRGNRIDLTCSIGYDDIPF